MSRGDDDDETRQYHCDATLIERWGAQIQERVLGALTKHLSEVRIERAEPQLERGVVNYYLTANSVARAAEIERAVRQSGLPQLARTPLRVTSLGASFRANATGRELSEQETLVLQILLYPQRYVTTGRKVARIAVALAGLLLCVYLIFWLVQAPSAARRSGGGGAPYATGIGSLDDCATASGGGCRLGAGGAAGHAPSFYVDEDDVADDRG